MKENADDVDELKSGSEMKVKVFPDRDTDAILVAMLDSNPLPALEISVLVAEVVEADDVEVEIVSVSAAEEPMLELALRERVPVFV